ncbi:MAG: hypothetical protein H0X37_11860 [Herpetosiphonaceae bacterium]|nr:hypothetical protein [Herpetosiphonaceae bacterium]
MQVLSIELDDGVYEKLAAEARRLHAEDADVVEGRMVDTESGRPLELDLESYCASLATALVEEGIERRLTGDLVSELEQRLAEAQRENQRLNTALADLKSYS